MKKSRLFKWLAVIGGLFIIAFVCTGSGLVGYHAYLLVSDFRGGMDGALRVESKPAPPQELQLQGEADLLDTPTLKVLENEVVPINDPIDLAVRLGKADHVPRKKPVGDLNREVGEKETFWVTNVDAVNNFQVETTLAAATEHAYFWIEEGIEYSQKEVDRLAKEFERTIYPTNHEFFGTEWTPGVDNDPHLYIVYARGLGGNVAGYFSSVDEYHPLAHEYSNAHETFMLNADAIDLGERYTYSVLAHEFQHMIHWYRDRNETSWLNEGFSELATLLNGYRFSGGFDYLYASDPDLQLNDWPDDPNERTPHYGSSFLFVTYFLDRFGKGATQALVSNDRNGLSSVDEVLQELEREPSSGGGLMDADDLFLDWAITNYLHQEEFASSTFQYNNYPSAPQFNPTDSITTCPSGDYSRDVHQYGVDYIRIDCEGNYRLQFEGEKSVRLLPADPHSGTYAYWSNQGDHSDMTLTRTFDLTDVSAPITLEYWTWYDIEDDYDYLYLEVSIDGEDWEILRTPSGTDEDPSGNSYGWGYNGQSNGDNGWIKEEIDLSDYAGKEIYLRFEYITDAAVNGEGFLLDDLSIPEIGYQTSFESPGSDWQGDGFVRVQNSLPQTYRLALIKTGPSPSIEYLRLSKDNALEVPLHFDQDIQEQILVVTGTTRYTRQKADYQIQVVEE